jgi:hypothetical protein
MDLVGGQIVYDDDVAWQQLWNERPFDIGEKGLAVHRAAEDRGRGDPVVAQTRCEGGGFPMAVWHGSAASLAPRGATVKVCHFGVRSGLVVEDDACRIEFEPPYEPCLAWPAFTVLRRCSAACCLVPAFAGAG